jgi:C4-dicarboxylate-specific signal transduction histidine kinase
LNAEGEVVELVGSTTDLTERKRTEEALHNARVHLDQMSQLTMMGELAASIAHEVNRPLASVATNGNACLRWLDREPPDYDEAREAVRRIIRDGIRGGDVIIRIRALLRKEPQSASLLNINEVIREILTLAQPYLRGVRVQFDSSEKVAGVRADPIQLQQVLLNLITNAVDAMKTAAERPKVLRIRTRMASAEMLLVQVEDSGIGLEGDIESLFEPFYTTKSNGLGMGLSISRSIIGAHGGRLWAERGREFGAIFQFTLPVESQAP